MSQENVEIIREMFAIVNERGVKAATDSLGDMLAPEFSLEEAAEVPDPASYTGRDAFIANMAKLEESFEELRLEPVEVVDLGEKIIVVVSMSGRGRGSGAAVQMTFAQLWLLRDGKAVSLRDYATREEALEGAGAA
ncbi:MAG TPA: nuclear transport factor 2 family protein [Thermoleophilaceae bacterium]